MSASSVLDSWDPDEAWVAQSRAVAQRIADTVAVSITIPVAAARLGVDRSRISHRLRQGTL